MYWREQAILYFQGLGRRHYGFGVHVDILQLMGPHFIASIYPQVWSHRPFILIYFDNKKRPFQLVIPTRLCLAQ